MVDSGVEGLLGLVDCVFRLVDYLLGTVDRGFKGVDWFFSVVDDIFLSTRIRLSIFWFKLFDIHKKQRKLIAFEGEKI
jgi:predicted Na+-dependent transporter